MLTDLSIKPISDAIRRLSAEQRTGELQVRSGKVVKTVFFDKGRLVFAASNLKKDRLGEALIAIGRITEHDFKRASALMKERRERFGDALVHAGVMGKDELGASVAKQVKRIVLSLFQLAEGAAFFEERPCPIPLEYMVSVSVHHTLYQGIRTMTDPKLILQGIGDLDRRVTLAEVPPFRFSLQRCSAEEREVLAQAQRKVTLRKLVVAPGKLAMPRVRAAYALLASGILKPVDQGIDTQPVVQMETGEFLLSALRKDPAPSPQEAIRQEVAKELERSAHLEPKKWLRLPEGASREDLIKAIQDKMDRFYELLRGAGDDEKLRAEIEVVLGRASIQLRQAQSEPVQTTPAPLARAADQAAAPGGGEEGLPEVELDLEEDEGAGRAEADSPDTLPATPEPEPEAGRAGAGEAAGGAQTPSADSTWRMTGKARFEHMLMEAEVRMTVGDYANAIKVYQKMVQMAPDVAAFRVKLGIAMAHYPRTSKLAERQFLEAARLEPRNADLHYQFGLYYKVMKQKPRAIAEFRTALRLKPRHKGARTELEALSPKDSALTSLRKLFK